MTNTEIPNTPRAQAAFTELIEMLRRASERDMTVELVESIMAPGRILLESIDAAAFDVADEDEVTRAQCHNCDLDIEGELLGEWFDRGGNRRCPSGELHVPH